MESLICCLCCWCNKI